MSNTAAVGVLIFHEIKSIKKEIKTSLNTKLKGSLTINLVPHWNVSIGMTSQSLMENVFRTLKKEAACEPDLTGHGQCFPSTCLRRCMIRASQSL